MGRLCSLRRRLECSSAKKTIVKGKSKAKEKETSETSGPVAYVFDNFATYGLTVGSLFKSYQDLEKNIAFFSAMSDTVVVKKQSTFLKNEGNTDRMKSFTWFSEEDIENCVYSRIAFECGFHKQYGREGKPLSANHSERTCEFELVFKFVEDVHALRLTRVKNGHSHCPSVMELDSRFRGLKRKEAYKMTLLKAIRQSSLYVRPNYTYKESTYSKTKPISLKRTADQIRKDLRNVIKPVEFPDYIQAHFMDYMIDSYRRREEDARKTQVRAMAKQKQHHDVVHQGNGQTGVSYKVVITYQPENAQSVAQYSYEYTQGLQSYELLEHNRNQPEPHQEVHQHVDQQPFYLVQSQPALQQYPQEHKGVVQEGQSSTSIDVDLLGTTREHSCPQVALLGEEEHLLQGQDLNDSQVQPQQFYIDSQSCHQFQQGQPVQKPTTPCQQARPVLAKDGSSEFKFQLEDETIDKMVNDFSTGKRKFSQKSPKDDKYQAFVDEYEDLGSPRARITVHSDPTFAELTTIGQKEHEEIEVDIVESICSSDPIFYYIINEDLVF